MMPPSKKKTGATEASRCKIPQDEPDLQITTKFFDDTITVR